MCRQEMGGHLWHVVICPVGDIGLYKCEAEIALLSAMSTNVELDCLLHVIRRCK